MLDRCPKCGSDRITKYLQWQKNKKSGGGSGCMGCLLFIIILILAPGLVLLFGLVAGAAIFALCIPLMIVVGVGLVLAIIVKVYQSGLFICEKCGHKFK
jgi:DNA-directed RNA polymerase subunit RPC12/RpoP